MREQMPLYQQIEENLREEIKSGKLQTHARLPSESELMTEYDVSRMTVRKALSRLEYEGLVYRQPGRGTFVAKQKIEQAISPMIGFNEKMKREGHQTRTKLLDSSIMDVEGFEPCCRALGLSAGAKVFRIQRLRYVDDEPAVIQTNYVPLELFPGIQYVDLQRSLTKVLQEIYGVEIKGYNSELQPTIPTEEEQKLLNLTKAIPLLSIESVSYDQRQRPIRFSKGLYRGDRFKFVVKEFEIRST
jgi:GntR family transcriptional regulator